MYILMKCLIITSIQSVQCMYWHIPWVGEKYDTCMLTGTGSRYVLNQVPLPILSAYWCMRQDWYGSAFIYGLTFCAGYYGGGMDACSVSKGYPLR